MLKNRRLIISLHERCNAKKEFYTGHKPIKFNRKFYHVAYRACEKLLYFNLQASKLLGIYPAKLDPRGNIVVSLTSFPARIASTWVAIDSIMRQSVRPDRVILNLTKEEFPGGYDSLPSSIKKYAGLGLEVVFRDENLRSHLKYFYTIQENPSSIIITIDDDLYYPSDTIERLIRLNEKYPNAVCANRTCAIAFDANSDYKPYNQWTSVDSAREPSFALVALGYGGVLYPSHLFVGSELFDTKVIRELSFTSDDLWLKVLETMADVPVATGQYMSHPPEIRLSRGVALQNVNRTKASSSKPTISGNDRQWQNINDVYDIKSCLDLEN